VLSFKQYNIFSNLENILSWSRMIFRSGSVQIKQVRNVVLNKLETTNNNLLRPATLYDEHAHIIVNIVQLLLLLVCLSGNERFILKPKCTEHK